MIIYKTITSDPPWPERGSGKCKRGADRHYSTMKVKDIEELLVELFRDRFEIAEHAHLYMWVTSNYMPGALKIIEAVDFVYKRYFVWVKDRISLGQYARGQHELCLFAVRGKGMDPSVMTSRKDISDVIIAPVPCGEDGKRIHSRKPEAFFQLVEARSNGPYLELFSRVPREGWTVWGNEVEEIEE